MPARFRTWIAACAVLLAAQAPAAEVQVAVAANFAAPLAKIAEGYTAATGHVLKASAGSTGRFFSQIVAGAPFDVLLAADDETPKKLLAAGHGVPGSHYTYAIGRLVLWSATPGLVDGEGAVLASPRWRHLAVADPKLAPYGAAAMEVLRARGLAQSLAGRIVTGETIAQAYQFVATGNAELGFVALSQVVQPGKPPQGSMWRVPAALHTEIRQDALLLKAGAANPAATALMDYLKTPAARALIQAYGYGP
jgi:molybdate transport system substrate-binding protein